MCKTKILDKKELYYRDFIYKEINCVKNDEMCGFLKLNFKILDKNFTLVILYVKKWLVWKTMKCADF